MMNDHDVSDDGSELLTRSARRSRTGNVNAKSAGSAATKPVAKSVTGIRLLNRKAHQPAATIGIHVLSRVNERSTIAPIHNGSQRSPRSRASRPAARAAISKARPQLS